MEWYIRRKFEWYNSELWLDDIPPDCQVLICLAGKDFIVNPTKIREEVESYSAVDTNFAKRTKFLSVSQAKISLSIQPRFEKKWRVILQLIQTLQSEPSSYLSRRQRFHCQSNQDSRRSGELFCS